MYLHKIQKQEIKLKKGVPSALDLKGKLAPALSDLYIKIEHPLENNISLTFIFENKNGSVFKYPKNFIRKGQPLLFDDNNYRFEGAIKSIRLLSDIDIEITIN
ncbi:MAG TPA: hypothetical protein VF868_13685 [Bacteroidia bacterium]|jgi:hypothetical protein